jgi:hypothetical protein
MARVLRQLVCGGVLAGFLTGAGAAPVDVGPREYERTLRHVASVGSQFQPYGIENLTAVPSADGGLFVGFEVWNYLSDAHSKLLYCYSPEDTLIASVTLGTSAKGLDLTPVADGVLATWLSSSGITARFYAPDCTPLGPSLPLSIFPLFNFVVDADRDGRFVVAYEQFAGATDRGVWARRFAANGAPLGPSWLVSTVHLGTLAWPYIALDAGLAGRFAIAWRASDGSIRARSFDGSVASGPELVANSCSPGGLPALAYTGPATFLVAWSGCGEGDPNGVFARHFLQDGTPLGDAWRVNEITTGAQYGAALGTGLTGELLVSWISADGVAPPYRTLARLYDATGSPLGPDFEVAQPSAGLVLVPEREVSAIVGSRLVLMLREVTSVINPPLHHAYRAVLTPACTEPVPATPVAGILWLSPQEMVWNLDPVCDGTFNVYRSDLTLEDADPDGVADDYGTCFESGLASPALFDESSPAPGSALFYLVTRATASGEGPLGTASNGLVRSNNHPCAGPD